MSLGLWRGIEFPAQRLPSPQCVAQHLVGIHTASQSHVCPRARLVAVLQALAGDLQKLFEEARPLRFSWRTAETSFGIGAILDVIRKIGIWRQLVEALAQFGLQVRSQPR
ncbi:hypothetical protein D3C87_1658520 [compost metagenome]